MKTLNPTNTYRSTGLSISKLHKLYVSPKVTTSRFFLYEGILADSNTSEGFGFEDDEE